MRSAACGVVGFVICTIPKIHYQVLLVATSIVGASAIILGVDCFSTAGLKEVIFLIHPYHTHLDLFYLVLCLEHRLSDTVSQV